MNQQPTNHHWNTPRWEGITRTYTPEDVARLSGTVRIEHTLARNGAEKLWQLAAKRVAMLLRWARSPATRQWRWRKPV